MQEAPECSMWDSNTFLNVKQYFIFNYLCFIFQDLIMLKKTVKKFPKTYELDTFVS